MTQRVQHRPCVVTGCTGNGLLKVDRSMSRDNIPQTVYYCADCYASTPEERVKKERNQSPGAHALARSYAFGPGSRVAFDPLTSKKIELSDTDTDTEYESDICIAEEKIRAQVAEALVLLGNAVTLLKQI